MALAGSTAVPAGATSVTVAISPATASYTPLITPGWNTTAGVSSVSATAFVVIFGTPAPAGGGTLYWTVQLGPATVSAGGQQETLSSYLDELRRLLHDPTDKYWPVGDKIAYLNRGLQRRDVDTGANRQLIPFTLTIGTDTYAFSDTGQGQVIDVITVNLIYGNRRIVLDEFPYSLLNVYVRPYSPLLQQVPIAFCRYGVNQLIFAPAPAQAYATEWDCSVYSVPLANLTDLDPLPYPYTAPVPLYAAYRAKLNERQYDEAAQFKGLYDEQLQSTVNARVAKVPSHYPGGLVRLS